MIDNYELYICDTETTGLDLINCDIVELSMIRYSTGEQSTWYLKAINYDAIEEGALRINGHKLEDITWKTGIGREKYKDPNTEIINIENWIMTDNIPTEKRVFVSYNVSFDRPRLELLWYKQQASDSFPFGRRSLNPMMTEFYMDLAKGKLADSYAQKEVAKKYGRKYSGDAHRADVDAKLLSEIFESQIDLFKKYLKSEILK